MKKSLLVASAAALALPLVLSPRPAAAQGAPAGGFGLGVEVGTLEGIDGQYYINQRNSLQFALGWEAAYYYDNSATATVDYLWHPGILTSGAVLRLGWHIGVGGALLFGHTYYHNGQYYHDDLGVRVPIGLDLLFNQQPIDIFVEAAPTVLLAPGDFFIWGNLGARFYF